MDYMMYQRGYGLGDDVLSGQFGLERMGMGGTRSRMGKLLSLFGPGVRFSDALRNQSTMANLFGQSSENVDPSMINQVMYGLNQVGGGFNMQDPRFMGRVTGLQSGLSRASSPFMQAMQYSVLRGIDSNAGMFDLMKMQEKGLQTPGYLSGVIGQISNMTGDDQTRMLMLKRMFPELSADAVQNIYTNRDRLQGMSVEQIRKLTEDTGAQERAERFTPRLTKIEARIENAFISSFDKGIKTVSESFIEEMSLANKEIAKRSKELAEEITPDMKEFASKYNIGPMGFGPGWKELFLNMFD